jgi:membrane protease YdiL (CAAX protease family)
MSIVRYYKESSHRFYGAVFSLIMLVFYEFFVLINSASSLHSVRNAPEAWLRFFLTSIGVTTQEVTYFLITVSLIALPFFYDSDLKVSWKILTAMLVESILWGAVSGFIIVFFLEHLLFFTGTISGSLLGDLGLAIGAGLFEELFFRVFLTSLLVWIFIKTFKVKLFAYLFSIIAASLLFSLAHYVGNMGDNFEIYSFTFRFLAGIWFTSLYATRGFAITAMSHAFYDIFVILF